MRRSALFVALVTVVLGITLPASAHISEFRLGYPDVSCVDATCDALETRSVSGSIECSPGEKYLVRVWVEQKEDPGPGYVGLARGKGTCSGFLQRWEAPIVRERGHMVCWEAFRMVGRAKTFVGGVQHGDGMKDVRMFELGVLC